MMPTTKSCDVCVLRVGAICRVGVASEVLYTILTDMAVRWLDSVLVVWVSLLVCVYGSSGPANVVLLLNDDQDLLLGGTTPMVFTKTFLQVTLEHSVATT